MIVTGGGTGGHLFPGIAVAEAMKSRLPQSKIMFICPGRPIDKQALGSRDFETISLKSRGLKGKGVFSQLQALLLFPFTLMAASTIVRNFKPDLVFGVGGYVTGPVLLAARLFGTPSCIHEQNSVPGLANRILGKVVNRIFLSFPESGEYFPKEKTILSGNPVRPELISAARLQQTKKTGSAPNNPTLLILGGSQGAHRVNILVLEAIASQQSAFPSGIQVIHQTGETDEKHVREHYTALGISARVGAFFHNIAELYQQADLVISRAGATTLTELAALKKPAILVPYPHAADNHQEKNGRFFVENGGAKMFIESELTGEKLGREIIKVLNNTEMRLLMAENMGKLAKPQAVDTIINECLDLVS